MRTLKFFVSGIALILASALQAQVSVNVNISPPLWGPVGYTQVHYYYLPDVEAYYDVQSSMFIYYAGGAWIHRTYLPSLYKGYDLYGGYKVVMTDYHGKTPYTHFKEHKTKYAKGYHGKYQRTVGEKPGKGHPYPKSYHNDNHGNKEGNGSDGKNTGHGDNHNTKKDHVNDGGNGKK